MKIGAINYKIKLVPKSDLADNDCGKCDKTNNTIYISSELSQEQQEITLIHEILHALNNEIKEREVDALAQQLHQVLKDNYKIDLI